MMDRRNLILGALAGVLLLIAIVYYATRPSAKARIPTEIRANCACLACRQHVRVEAKVVDPVPYECPECGERAAYPLFPIMPSCAACGSRNVGAYAGDETIAADELILPPWPQ